MFDRLLQHLQHYVERIQPNFAAADRSEMLFAMHGWAGAPSEPKMDEVLFGVRASEACSRERKVGPRMHPSNASEPPRPLPVRGLRIRPHYVRAGCAQCRVHPLWNPLKKPSSKPWFAPSISVGSAVSMPPVQLSAVANLSFLSHEAVHEPVGPFVQMIWKGRLERFAQPRSPFLGAGA